MDDRPMTEEQARSFAAHTPSVEFEGFFTWDRTIPYGILYTRTRWMRRRKVFAHVTNPRDLQSGPVRARCFVHSMGTPAVGGKHGTPKVYAVPFDDAGV